MTELCLSKNTDTVYISRCSNPHNLGALSFSIIEQLAELKYVDILVHVQISIRRRCRGSGRAGNSLAPEAGAIPMVPQLHCLTAINVGVAIGYRAGSLEIVD
jgi:hypothetical protein